MRWRSMGSIFITSAIIRARATCCSFLQSGKTQNVQVQCSVVNGSGGSSNTTRAKPHEFFDHTGNMADRESEAEALLREAEDQLARVDHGPFSPQAFMGFVNLLTILPEP